MSTSVPPTRRGFTLIELMVVVSIVAITTTVASVAMTSALAPTRGGGTWPDRLEQGRLRAIETGDPVVVVPDSAHREPPVLFLPDGRAVGRDVDRLTGRMRVER